MLKHYRYEHLHDEHCTAVVIWIKFNKISTPMVSLTIHKLRKRGNSTNFISNDARSNSSHQMICLNGRIVTLKSIVTFIRGSNISFDGSQQKPQLIKGFKLPTVNNNMSDTLSSIPLKMTVWLCIIKILKMKKSNYIH